MYAIFFVFYIYLLNFINATANIGLHNTAVNKKEVLTSVPYNGYLLDVWTENNNGTARYYVTPPCELINSSIKCYKDMYSDDNSYAFSFKIRLWHSSFAELVLGALLKMKIQTERTNIMPLPMLETRLKMNHKMQSKFKTVTEWIPNISQQNVIPFNLYTTNEFCQKIMRHATSNPLDFLTESRLALEFTLTVATRNSRNLAINSHLLIQSTFFAQLSNKYNEKYGKVYLNSDDLNKLARDITQTVSIVSDETAGYVPSSEDSSIIAKLLDTLNEQKVQSDKLTQSEWDSVFWNNIFTRPDVQTEYFNKTFSYDSSNRMFKYNNESDKAFRNAMRTKYGSNHEEGGGSEIGYEGFKIAANGYTKQGEFNEDDQENSGTNREKMSLEKMNALLNQDDVHVKWTGQQFTQKPMDLHRVNLRKLQMSGDLNYVRVVTESFGKKDSFLVHAEAGTNDELPHVMNKLNQLDKKINEIQATINRLNELTNLKNFRVFLISLFYNNNFQGERRDLTVFPWCTSLDSPNGWNGDSVKVFDRCVVLCSGSNCDGECAQFNKDSLHNGVIDNAGVYMVGSYKAC